MASRARGGSADSVTICCSPAGTDPGASAPFEQDESMAPAITIAAIVGNVRKPRLARVDFLRFMATMTSPDTPHASTVTNAPGPSTGISRWKLGFSLIAIAAIVYALWQLPTWKQQAEVGAAYGARMGCSCRFIQARDLPSCSSDFEPGMGMVSLSEVEGEQAVTASVPLLASRTARLSSTTGCLLDPED